MTSYKPEFSRKVVSKVTALGKLTYIWMFVIAAYLPTNSRAGHVPVSPAMTDPTNNLEHVRAFADRIGYPIMIKAIDGGGGRGIRLVTDAGALPAAFERAVKESPSRQVFAERAAIDGFHHIEVQIVGDGKGGVRHLWERECSIQRRYQKVIELGPSLVKDRALISKVIQDAITMAQKVLHFCA